MATSISRSLVAPSPISDIVDNLKAVCDAVAKSRPSTVKGFFIQSAVVHTTMGPGIKITFDGSN
jgi:ribosomal protein L1